MSTFEEELLSLDQQPNFLVLLGSNLQKSLLCLLWPFSCCAEHGFFKHLHKVNLTKHAVADLSGSTIFSAHILFK